MCEPTHWKLQIGNPEGCEECGCNSTGTIAGNNVCNVVSMLKINECL